MKPLSAMGRFATVVIDPPWPMSNFGMVGNTGLSPENPISYDLMTLNDIRALPVHDCLDDNSYLFCWTLNRHVEATFSIVRGWGCDYSFLMTWVKNGGIQTPVSPMFNAEWCLVGRKGSPKFLETKAFPTASYWPRSGHSEKPEGFYDLLRRVTPEPRLDIFGRRRIPGFYSWGNEAPEGEPLPGYYQDVLDLA